MSLNQFCTNNVSDEDCNKCMKFGIKFRCPNNCPYFEDARDHISEWARKIAGKTDNTNMYDD